MTAVRVVAGSARGRVLRAPPGRGTRPTSDRVREAVFSMLTSMDAVGGARVFDLFAGSGALGIEALSRGAAAATFVDSDRGAIDAITDNLAVLGATASLARVVRADALTFSATAPGVDLVLADPPYGFERWDELLSHLARRCRLLVAEGGSELAARWEPGPAWETVKVKRYGATVVVVAVVVAQAMESRAVDGRA